ncbi:8412_t:CDS:2, partial [Racocetra persica]
MNQVSQSMIEVPERFDQESHNALDDTVTAAIMNRCTVSEVIVNALFSHTRSMYNRSIKRQDLSKD